MLVEYLTLERLTDLYKFYGGNAEGHAHITYNEKLDLDNQEKIDAGLPKNYCDIRIIRSMKYDGTLSHLYDLILDAFNGLVLKQTFDKSKGSENIIGYEIGKARIEHHQLDHNEAYIEEKGIFLHSRCVLSIPVLVLRKSD